jgi:dTDP-4-dehydrorhamnose reductase
MKVLVLGAAGMLGNAVLRVFAASKDFDAVGSVRSLTAARLLPASLDKCLVTGFDVENGDSLVRLFCEVRPQLVVNCVGLVKQREEARAPLSCISINSLLPHRLDALCAAAGARLVHISTDCVFSGRKGMYTEADVPDAEDLYGRTKFLGEVDSPNAITLRTSIIGHELASAHSLVGWFLSQRGAVKGYTRAIFSGLPTVEVARAIRDHVVPRPELHGLYHISAAPIAKYELLQLVAAAYGRDTPIVEDGELVIDRSLDSARFRCATGFAPAPWPELVGRMREFG